MLAYSDMPSLSTVLWKLLKFAGHYKRAIIIYTASFNVSYSSQKPLDMFAEEIREFKQAGFWLAAKLYYIFSKLNAN